MIRDARGAVAVLHEHPLALAEPANLNGTGSPISTLEAVSLPEQSRIHHVRSVRWREDDHMKEISFEGDAPPLRLARSACVSKGDEVLIESNGAWVLCQNGRAQILPVYVARERLRVGALDLEFVIKEITEAEEFTAYKALTRFHYRSHVLRGRTARLIVRSFHPIYPQVVGFIELATPFYMNKAVSAP